MRAHLKIENARGEVVLDEDVNDFQVGTRVYWQNWEHGRKDMKNEHQISLRDLAKVEITPCQDRLKKADPGEGMGE